MAFDLEKTLSDLEKHMREQVALIKYRNILPEKIFRFYFNDIPISLYLPDGPGDLIQREIIRTSNFFEYKLLESLSSFCKPGMTVCDIGSNIGNHAIFFSKVLQASTVYCFEPQRSRFTALLKNIYLNDLSGVQAFRTALGATEGLADISVYRPWNYGAVEFTISDIGSFPVNSLDSYEFQRCDLIKIDVEGFQDFVLNGAKETIIRLSPLIWIELRKTDNSHAFEFLSELGYDVEAQLSDSDFLFSKK